MIFRKKSGDKNSHAVKKDSKVKKESRLKIDPDEDVQEGEVVETEWDIKKIAIGLVGFVLLIIIGSYVFFPPSAKPSQEALGANTQSLTPTPALPNKDDVQGVLNNAKDTLSKITSENLTSSQAAIQQIISDLQQLQGKNGALKLFCNTVCKK